MTIQPAILAIFISIGLVTLIGCGAKTAVTQQGSVNPDLELIRTELKSQSDTISRLQSQMVAVAQENQQLRTTLAAYGLNADRLTIEVKEIAVIDDAGTKHLHMHVDKERQAVLFLGDRPILGSRNSKAVLLADAVHISDLVHPGKSITVAADATNASIFMADQGRSTISIQTGKDGDPGVSLLGTDARQMILLGLSKSVTGESILLLSGKDEGSTTRITAGRSSGIILKDVDGQRVFTTVTP